jgi:hypothetical protein
MLLTAYSNQCQIGIHSCNSPTICLDQVVNIWVCPGFRNQAFPFAASNYFGYFGVWIIRIAEIHAAGRADRNAGRLFTILNAVDAEGAFVDISFRVNEACIIGAGCNTGFAADAFISIHQDCTTIRIMTGLGRAASYTG